MNEQRYKTLRRELLDVLEQWGLTNNITPIEFTEIIGDIFARSAFLLAQEAVDIQTAETAAQA